MIITIYDYLNKEKKITLPDKEVANIVVAILSGDETGLVEFADGEQVRFDASDTRYFDFCDGVYTLTGENIKKWIDFKPTDDMFTISYARQRIFDVESEGTE